MINKLFLSRVKKTNVDTYKELGIDTLIVGNPISVSPIAWREEDGLSHYGVVLNMKFKQFKQVESVIRECDTLLDLEMDKGTKTPDIDATLKKVGLRVHPSDE